MKKVCLVLMVMLLATSTVSAQESDKRAQREARKEAQKKVDDAIAEKALKAINERRFVLEIDKVSFRNGMNAFTSPRMNFIMLDGDKATVQLSSSSYPYLGPNGIGGITVEGRPTNYMVTTDKKGNVSISMSVQGIAISAQVSINVPKNSNRGIAIVVPNFNPYRITLKGLILPLDESDTFKGRVL